MGRLTAGVYQVIRDLIWIAAPGLVYRYENARIRKLQMAQLHRGPEAWHETRKETIEP